MSNIQDTQSNREKYIERTKKLLAKAEGASTEAEAEAFLAKVTQLMAEWEIADHELRGRGEATSSDAVSEIVINIGSYTPKADAIAMNSIVLAVNLRGGFSPYYSGHSASMLIIGRESDLERFTLLWTSLEMQMVRAMKREEPKGVDRGTLRAYRQSFKMSFCDAAAKKITEVRESFGSALVHVDAEVAERANQKFGKAKRVQLRTSFAGSAAGHAAGKRADVNTSTRVGGSTNRKALGS
jgi:hypothetical protein